MPVAATTQDVKDITGSTLDDAVIQPFIDAADCIMLRVAEVTASMTATCVDQATTYLSAHLLTSSSVGKDSAIITKESLRGKYSVEYLTASITKSGVLSSTHGQTANMMLGGALAELDKSPAGMFSIGTIGDTWP